MERLLALWMGGLLALAPCALAQTPASDPLPLDVALSLRGHNGRSPVNLSPDGEWVAHTVESADTVPRGASSAYSATGFPFAEGNARMEATLSRVDGDEVIRLGGPDSSSWAPVFSPDGERVGFYSDAGGEAGLWIWTRETREARRIEGVVVRPFFGFEGVRWAPDSRRLLVKLLPEDLTLEEANALLPAPQAEPPAPELDPNEASVVVRRSTAFESERSSGSDDRDAPPASDPLAERIAGFTADLAVVDTTTGRVERIVEREAVRMYAFSPNGTSIAYTVLSSYAPNTQQPLYELRRHDLSTESDHSLAEDLRLSYGIEWSWSPDGRFIAYTDSGQLGDGSFAVVDVRDGPARTLENEAPPFAAGEGEVPPIWSGDAQRLYGVAEGALWAVDVASGAAREAAAIDDWRIRVLLTPSWNSATAFSRDGGETLWVTAREEESGRFGLFSVRVASGETRAVYEEEASWSHLFSLAANEITGDAVYVSRSQQQVGELWVVDTATGEPRQVSRINHALDRYALGEARILEWRSANGEPLRGALLLPPGYERDTGLPLVVWVYAGANGSDAIHRFGLWGAMPTFNMHLLATRGFAVLFPDVPVRTGRLTDDLVASVLPAVNAAIEQGYADRERLALMGQSFGSFNVLALLTRTDRFDAAVITAAVLHPDLFADYLSGSSTGYWEQGQGNMGGTIWEQPERYRDNSPLFDFPEITTPLLIGQGDQDGDLVPVDAIFNALERLDKKVEYRLYRGESHVISRRANVLDFWNRRLEFLAEHLDLEVEENGRVTVPQDSP
ncbi:MAG TPA: prolyl oligopeptidase family serine peptidase [Thermoanaerobaculia bacterium]|nr:prolyl oligopeptidase family serine peptidase [Thermoanaerobaculia bacterium]